MEKVELLKLRKEAESLDTGNILQGQLLNHVKIFCRHCQLYRTIF